MEGSSGRVGVVILAQGVPGGASGGLGGPGTRDVGITTSCDGATLSGLQKPGRSGITAQSFGSAVESGCFQVVHLRVPLSYELHSSYAPSARRRHTGFSPAIRSHAPASLATQP